MAHHAERPCARLWLFDILGEFNLPPEDRRLPFGERLLRDEERQLLVISSSLREAPWLVSDHSDNNETLVDPTPCSLRHRQSLDEFRGHPGLL